MTRNTYFAKKYGLKALAVNTDKNVLIMLNKMLQILFIKRNSKSSRSITDDLIGNKIVKVIAKSCNNKIK